MAARAVGCSQGRVEKSIQDTGFVLGAVRQQGNAVLGGVCFECTPRIGIMAEMLGSLNLPWKAAPKSCKVG